MSWFDNFRRGSKRTAGDGDDVLPSTPSEQWTVSGIRFDTTGWKLVDSSPGMMSWSSTNATLVLTQHASPIESARVSLSDYRNQQRAQARDRGEDIVLLEIFAARQGQILSAVRKRPSGLRLRYRGLGEFHAEAQEFRLESDIGEVGTTGVREAMVNAMRVSCGEFALGPQNPDGSHQVQGLLIDAYDSAFDEGALNSLSDDERLDILFPAHPLSRTRALLRTVAASLVLRNGAVASTHLQQDSAMSGPRRQLSLSVLHRLFGAAGRFDLMEESLKEEISSRGDALTLEVAAGLVQVGVHYHTNDRPGNALPLLTRAESMFVQLAGDDAPATALARAHRGVALFKMGREAQALPPLLQAIRVMESTVVHPETCALALATAAQIFARNGNKEDAASHLERAQKLMAEIRR